MPDMESGSHGMDHDRETPGRHPDSRQETTGSSDGEAENSSESDHGNSPLLAPEDRSEGFPENNSQTRNEDPAAETDGSEPSMRQDQNGESGMGMIHGQGKDQTAKEEETAVTSAVSDTVKWTALGASAAVLVIGLVILKRFREKNIFS